MQFLGERGARDAAGSPGHLDRISEPDADGDERKKEMVDSINRDSIWDRTADWWTETALALQGKNKS